MYGYASLVPKFWIKTALGALVLIVTLVFFGVWLIESEVLNTEEYIALTVALLTGIIAISAIFLQIRLSLRRKLEADAIGDILDASKHFTEAGSMAVTFKNDFVVKPLEIPPGFWINKSYEKYEKVAKTNGEIRDSFTAFYFALETHEIAIIHLEHYYRFITIKIGDFIDKIDTRNSQLLNTSGEAVFDENAYKLKVATAFEGIMEEWVVITTYLMDFRKILQTDLLGRTFLRELHPRKPYDGSNTLQQVATEERVRAMIYARDTEYRAQLPNT